MSAFGTLAPSTVDQGLSAAVYAAIKAGYTPDNDLGDLGILAAIVGSMLQDAIPAPAGTSAAPAIAFQGDSDTGFFRVGANEIGVAASGANVGGWTSTGFKAGSTSSTPITKFVVYSVSLVPTTLASAVIVEQTFAVTGITTADKIFVNHVTLGAAISNAACPISWRVGAADAVIGAFINLSNVTSCNAASGTYKIVAIAS